MTGDTREVCLRRCLVNGTCRSRRKELGMGPKSESIKGRVFPAMLQARMVHPIKGMLRV